MFTISDQPNIQNKKIFHFLCKKCNGYLTINLNPNTFLINAKCESDFNHVFNNLYIITFEQFYMKEKQPYKCFSCNNISNNNEPFYYCNSSNKIYCKNCKSKEERNDKQCKWKLIEEFKCNTHNNNFTSYCKLCDINICSVCEEEKHKQHKTIKYSSIILTKKDIEYSNKKLKEKEKFTNAIIEKMNTCKLKKINNINRLILNLKNELSFLQKMF